MNETQIFYILYNIFKLETDIDHGLNILNNPLIPYTKHMKMHEKTLEMKYAKEQVIIQFLYLYSFEHYVVFKFVNIITLEIISHLTNLKKPTDSEKN